MPISKSTVIFLSIIVMVGILTMISDLRTKKIYNYHLVIGAVLGLAALLYAAVWAHENILFHIINGLVAFAAGYFLHRFSLWRGGDAKLFTLYAFLMPPLEGRHILLSSAAINLFSCSFIAGAIILMPVFIKDFASNYSAVINSKKLQTLSSAIRITIVNSWTLFPVYYCANFLRFPAISLVITYFIFYLSSRFNVQKEANPVMLVLCITFGALERFYLSPGSLSWQVLPYSILKIGLLAGLSACIYATIDHLKQYNDRIPFAPLLFTGCSLSYTPFLTWIMHLINR